MLTVHLHFDSLTRSKFTFSTTIVPAPSATAVNYFVSRNDKVIVS